MRVQFKKSPWLVRLIVAIILVFCMVTLIRLGREFSEMQRETEALEAEIAQVQQTNAALSEDIEKMDTDEGVKEVARDKLGLVSEGEITFYDIGG